MQHSEKSHGGQRQDLNEFRKEGTLVTVDPRAAKPGPHSCCKGPEHALCVGTFPYRNLPSEGGGILGSELWDASRRRKPVELGAACSPRGCGAVTAG